MCVHAYRFTLSLLGRPSGGSRRASIRRLHAAALGVLALLLSAPASRAQIERKQIDFKDIEGLAAEAARNEFQPAGNDNLLPPNLQGLTYDRYRNIRFRPEKEFWRPDELPFGMALFHLGYLYKQPIAISEFTNDYTQEVRFSREFFDYTGSEFDGALPADLGYAGFRLTHPLNRPDYYDEIAVFQGASYYRALGKGQVYGMSARGLAIDSGIDGVTEEFPVFTHFWVGKPAPGATSMTLFALLNSPSVAGAYQFVVTPGEDTVAHVSATLFFRKELKHAGFAPLTSMFWFGENTTRPFDDYRPEVHDSDGLVMKSGSGECLWRPLRSESARSQTYVFSFDDIKGFGLIQRDRNARSYEDFEAQYHLRPGVWVEPEGSWGPGRVRLVEMATAHELSDNVVAAWEPDAPPQPGEPYRIAYRQYWTLQPNPAAAGSWVVATRTGTHEWAPDTRFVVLEFAGPALRGLKADQTLKALVSLDKKVAALTGPPRVERYPGGDSWRVAFEVKKLPAAASVEGTEVRCSLKLGDDYLSETWTSWLNL